MNADQIQSVCYLYVPMIFNVSDISAAEYQTAVSSRQLLTFMCLMCKPNESMDNLALVCVCLVTRGRVVQGGANRLGGGESELTTGRVVRGASWLGDESSRGRIDHGVSRLEGELIRRQVFLLPNS